jgi:proteasome lid subunit RPN8/RPN11
MPNLSPPFPDVALTRIVTHSEICPDSEVCGFLIKRADGEIECIESDNTALNPKTGFKIDRQLFDKEGESGQVLALYHSHWADWHSAELSVEDIRQSKKLGIPYLLYHPIEKIWDYYDPNSLDPFPLVESICESSPTSIDFYLGWRWVWARADCYTLMRHYYRGLLNIDLPDFDRAPTPEEQLTGTWDRFAEAMPAIGFVPVDSGEPLRDHDLLLMRMNGEVTHHCGIITNAEKPEFIHHLAYPRVSDRRMYGAYWKEITVQRLRWKEFA